MKTNPPVHPLLFVCSKEKVGGTERSDVLEIVNCVYKIRTKPKASVIVNQNATDILLSQLSLFFRLVPSKLLGNPSIFKFKSYLSVRS